jgi:chromosome segregation ATPase
MWDNPRKQEPAQMPKTTAAQLLALIAEQKAREKRLTAQERRIAKAQKIMDADKKSLKLQMERSLEKVRQLNAMFDRKEAELMARQNEIKNAVKELKNMMYGNIEFENITKH